MNAPRCLTSIRWLLVLLASISTVQAHNVVSGVYADGMLIEGEIGFSNGDMAEAGVLVSVLNASGEVIAETLLAEGGLFTYEAKTVAKHVFKANLSAGHIAEMVIEADELTSTGMSVTPAATPAEKARSQTSAKADSETPINQLTAAQLQSMVRSAVAQQVKPLQKELRAYKEKVMFRDIAGGLGFIFGLFGVAAWMASKRKQGDSNATVS